MLNEVVNMHMGALIQCDRSCSLEYMGFALAHADLGIVHMYATNGYMMMMTIHTHR